MTASPLPVWRSLLFVPVNVERFVAKAHERGSDGLILDLEDSVAPGDKASARTLVAPTVARLRRVYGGDLLVRINQPLELAVPDLEAAIIAGVTGVVVTKVEGPDHLRLLDEMASRLEGKRGLPDRGIRFLGLVEGPRPLMQAYEIARSTPRLAALSLGGEDYATAIGGKPTEDVLTLPKQQILQAARAAGITPMGTVGTVADYSDIAGYTRIVRRSADFGFVGSACIHPAQVGPLNAGFSPSAEEVAYAERMVALDAEAAKSGRGSFALDGKMIDIPVVDRAKALLARARAIAARERASRR